LYYIYRPPSHKNTHKTHPQQPKPGINLETRPTRPAEGARELSKRGTSVVDEERLSLVYLFEGGL
jgi:hypothetical protein